uniref:Uncharacterized protein n=1 Tax=Anguilla anguilla TaxID=7936 RepID=A0A0E9U5M8_ANGAN
MFTCLEKVLEFYLKNVLRAPLPLLQMRTNMVWKKMYVAYLSG